MSARLVENSYGKCDVRLTKVTRHSDRHELKELDIDVKLVGDFADSYLSGDNSKVIATDSIRNTVYVLAKRHPIDSIDSFAAALVGHFTKTYPQVRSTRVTIGQRAWRRIRHEGKPHPHAFIAGSNERRTCLVTNVTGEVEYHAGVEGLVLLKTTDSAFTGYVRDQFTTLPETDDRILATRVTADWAYRPTSADWNEYFDAVRQTLLDVFATHKSLSVQQTLYAMGEAVLSGCDYVEQIRIAMPNQHRIPFNFAPLGLKFENDIFVPTDEPYGLITGTLKRE